MNEEEYEVMEDEFYRQYKRLGFNPKKAQTNKEYMACIFYETGSWSRRGLHNNKYHDNGWKKKRKTQYRVKEIKEEKKRKPREKEYWRYKQHERYYFGFRPHTIGVKLDDGSMNYDWDRAFSAIGFLESLTTNDYLVPKNAGFNYYYDSMYKVCGVAYRTNERDSVYVKVRAVRDGYLADETNELSWPRLIEKYIQKKFNYVDRLEYESRKYPYTDKFDNWLYAREPAFSA